MKMSHDSACHLKLKMFFQENREKTFKTWKFKDSTNCNAKKLAEAGFYFIGTEKDPDAVECFFCDKQLDGWDKDDDPWEEHLSHAGRCDFASLHKSEQATTVEELKNSYLQLVQRNLKKYTESIFTVKTKEFNTRLAKIRKTVNAKKSLKKK